MQVGPFTNFIAEELHVDAATVAIYARELRKAGLLTTGARGVNAPHMRPIDAARLLIAFMATDRPSEAVACVDRWRAMCLLPKETKGDLPDYLAGELSLEQALVRILAVNLDPTEWPQEWPAFSVARNERIAKLEWGQGGSRSATFRDGTPATAEDRRQMGGIRRSCLVAPSVLLNLAAGMWVDRFKGTDDKGLPLELNHPWNLELARDERVERVKQIRDYIRARDGDWLAGSD